MRQPGEPLASTFEFENIGAEQVLHFTLTAIDSDLKSPQLEINNYKEIQLPVELKKGQVLKYTGGPQAQIYSSNWRLVREIPIDTKDFTLSSGSHTLAFDCQFNKDGEQAAVKIEVRTFAEAATISLN